MSAARRNKPGFNLCVIMIIAMTSEKKEMRSLAAWPILTCTNFRHGERAAVKTFRTSSRSVAAGEELLCHDDSARFIRA